MDLDYDSQKSERRQHMPFWYKEKMGHKHIVFSKMGTSYIFHWDNASTNENISHKELEILYHELETTCPYSCKLQQRIVLDLHKTQSRFIDATRQTRYNPGIYGKSSNAVFVHRQNDIMFYLLNCRDLWVLKGQNY